MQIYVSIWSIERTIHREGLSLTDVPLFVRQQGFRGIELSDRDVGGYDRSSLQHLRQCCDQAECGVILDVNCDLTYSTQSLWQEEILHVSQMLDVAKDLGAQAVRICLGGQALTIQKLLKRRRVVTSKDSDRLMLKKMPESRLKTLVLNRWIRHLAHHIRKNLPSPMGKLEEKTARAVLALRELVPQAGRYEIPLVIENHWGISSRPENIIRVIDEVKTPWLGTCPDFGNFPRDVDLYEGLKLLAPKALHAQAKSTSFRNDGEEKHIDYKRCLQMLRESRYDRTLSVEYEGTGNDLEGCLRTRELIVKYW